MSIQPLPVLLLAFGLFGCATGGGPCESSKQLNETLRQGLKERAMQRLIKRELSLRLVDDSHSHVCHLILDPPPSARLQPRPKRLDDSPVE